MPTVNAMSNAYLSFMSHSANNNGNLAVDPNASATDAIIKKLIQTNNELS